MMNHQGGLGQSSSNASIQDEINLLGSIGSVGFLSSSSHIGSTQRISDSLYGPNFLPRQEHDNLVPSNDGGAGILRRNLDLNVEYVENDPYTNQNVSLGLCLHPLKPDGPEYQCDSSSDSMAIDSRSSHVVDGQGADSSSIGMRFLSRDRYPEQAYRELLIGESSSSAVQARIPISQAASSQVNASNSLNVSAPYIGPANIHQQQFEVGIGRGTVRPVSNMQQFGEARYGSANNVPVSSEAGIFHGTPRQVYGMRRMGHARPTGRFQSNIHHQTAANPQTFLPFSRSSTGHTRNSHVHLSSQTPWYHHDHPRFFSPAQTSVGAIPSMQPYVQVPNVNDMPQASPWANIMEPRSVPHPFPPAYTAMRGGTVINDIQRNIMLEAQAGRGVQRHNLANMSFGNGTANFLGTFPSPSHYGSSSHLSSTTGGPVLNVFEQLMHMSSGDGNQSEVAPISFTVQSGHSPFDLNLSAVSQEMYLATGFGNVRPVNQYMTVPIPENQSGVNTGPSADARSSLATEVANTLEHLRRGGSVRIEELLILDYSLLLFMLEAHQTHEEEEEDDNEEDASGGLSEEAILMHLRHEKFQSSAPGTSENVGSCCICQEGYADGEDIGVLDCSHKFHFDCIKKWLEIKNDCPICKQSGLAV